MYDQNAQLLFKEILRGNVDIPDPPSRIIKCFISSSGKTEFNNERIQLHEYIFPELQRHCAQLGLDLLIVDTNWQYTGNESTTISSTSLPPVPTNVSTYPAVDSTTSTIAAPITKQQSVDDNQPTSPKTTKQTGIPPDVNNILQITESSYIDQILQTSKDILDPNLFALELEEISDCYNQSVDVFFLTLIGHKYKPFVLPTSLSVGQFDRLQNCSTNHNDDTLSLLLKYYKADLNANEYERYRLIELKDQFGQLRHASNSIRNHLTSTNQSNVQQSNAQSSDLPTCSPKHLQQSIKINIDLLQFCFDLNQLLKLMQCSACAHSQLHLRSALYLQLKHAISINQEENDRIVACVRRFEVDQDNENIAACFPGLFDLATTESGIKTILDELICNIPKSNIHFFTLPWSVFQSDRDTNNNNNLASKQLQNSWQLNLPSDYSNKFTDYLFNTLRKSITEQAAKRVQAYFDYPPNELFHELHSHVANCRKNAESVVVNPAIHETLLKIQQIMQTSAEQQQTSSMLSSTSPLLLTQNAARHPPIVVVGCEGTGKSTILAQVFSECQNWFEPAIEIVRIVRLIGQSPASCYSSELLRTLCVNISLAFGNDVGALTTVDHDQTSLATWLNELLKIVELNFSDHALIILLDDLHLVKSLKSKSTVLSWFPFSLPSNVHLVCSVDERDDALLDILRTRISVDKNFVRLQTTYENWPIIQQIVANKLFACYERTLTSNQWRFLEAKSTSFKRKTMLYLNLLATNELKNWTSYESKEIAVRTNDGSKDSSKESKEFTIEALPTSIEQLLNASLVKLERAFGAKILAKICTYLANTRYGLREVELIELISSEDTLQSNPIHSWLSIKNTLSSFLSENYILGRPYLNWQHTNFRTEVQHRYVKSDLMRRRIHTELANAFYLGFTDILQQENSITLHTKDRQPNTDILRELDELYFHLCIAGDLYKLKTFAVLNIDFLMACVQNASISYLRSILELIKGLFYDWEIELLYNMTKNCITSVSQEPVQFAIELLIWLKQFSSIGPLNLSEVKEIKESPRHLASQAKHLERNLSVGGSPTHCRSSNYSSGHSSTNFQGSLKDKQQHIFSPPVRSTLLDNLIRSTLAWCVHSTSIPLLVPLNSWLNLLLPSQVTAVSLKQSSISNAVLSENKQNLIFSQGKQILIFHLATKELVRTIEAHKAPITCLSISATGKYLATGCEDSIVNIYEIIQQDQLNCKTKYRLSSQVSGIMSCTFTHNEELILTGSVSGSICVHLLDTGNFLTKLDLHRSMVTSICVNTSDDIFASCSTDGLVTITSLADFCVLNQILLSRPILHMDLSLNSTFLMLSTDDNAIYICALSTGTQIHCIEPTTNNPSTVVTQLRFSNDSCRALVGTGDGRLLIYDVHSAKLLQCHSSHSDMIVSIITYAGDNFLLTCGSSKAILWNFIARRPVGADPAAFTVSSALIPVVTTNVSVVNQPVISSITYTTAGQTNLTSSYSSVTNQTVTTTTQSQSFISASIGTSSSTGNLAIAKRLSVKSRNKVDNHRDLIVCMDVSKCGNYLITGSRDCLVKTWLLNTGETQYTFEGHNSSISCVAFANNLSFCISGSDDRTIRLWTLNNTLTGTISQFLHHQFKIQNIFITSDSKRVMSVDVSGVFRLWQTDSGIVLLSFCKQSPCIQQMVGNMLFQIAGKNNNCVRYWSVYDADIEKNVSHTESITCYIVSFDCETLITGSSDSSLKVWEIKSAKLTQVLVGHQQQITCVAVAPFSSSKVLSGSTDCSLIVWDASTGSDVLTLNMHRGAVSFCQLSLDGSTAISCGEDNRLIVWDVSENSNGQPLILMDIHSAINQFKTTHNLNHVILLPNSSSTFAIFQFLRNPAQQRSLDELTPIHRTKNEVDRFTRQLSTLGQLGTLNRLSNAKRVMKREQSFDSFYWDHHLHRGLSVDDFSKLPAIHGLLSPHGSRDNLLLANTSGQLSTHTGSGILTPTAGTIEKPTAASALSRPSRLVSKLMGSGKQKILKKQQSMFACFPEHSISSNVLSAIGKPQSPLASPQLVTSQLAHPLASTTTTSNQVKNNFQNLTTNLNKDFETCQKMRNSIRNDLLFTRSQSLEETKEDNEIRTVVHSDSSTISGQVEASKCNTSRIVDSSICSIS